MLRFLTAGESHGRCLTAILEGLPAGVPVRAQLLDRDLARRQRGYGRGARMAIETDRVTITAGVRHGLSLGSPISLTLENREGETWAEEMSAEPLGEKWTSGRSVRVPRPGHADLAGAAKYRHRDMRNVLERSSARETAARVAVGAVCRAFLQELGITAASVVCSIGGVAWEPPEDWTSALLATAEASDVSCPDESVAEAMRQEINAARQRGDTLGGVFEVRAFGVPPGLGSHVHWDRKLDGNLAAALMSIPAIKGIEVGLGFRAAERPGSQVHDHLNVGEAAWPIRRPSNHAGGIEGGMSNGEALVLRAAMKPIPTLTQPLPSVNLDTLLPAAAHSERSDVCAVPAAAVVGEAMVLFELARAALEKLGGDHLTDVKAALAAYREDLQRLWAHGGGN